MSERKIHLASGDTLIRTEEGVYYRVNDGSNIPLLIEREEGELLAFGTSEQLEITLKILSEKLERYEKTLEFYAFEVASLNEDGATAKKALGYSY